MKINDLSKSAFVSSKDILNLLQNKGFNLVGQHFSSISLPKVESALQNFSPVENVEVYKTLKGKVVIEVTQRKPIIRIIDANDRSYYIDDKGFIMKLSGNYTSRVIVANGNIRTILPDHGKFNVLDAEKQRNNKYLLADLFKLATYISSDKFWNAQIQQIYVNADGDYELIPSVGAQVILFGDYSDCETKFTNLMSLYKNALPVVGWNKYESINLKYKGQIVCTKRE